MNIENKKEAVPSEEVAIDLESFTALWEVMAIKAYKQADVSVNRYLLHIQCFTEHFFFAHLQLTKEEIIEFGYVDDVKHALNHLKMFDILEPILFIGANYVFHQNEGLMKQAYEGALKLYAKYSKDTNQTKQAVKNKYENQHEKYAQKILDSISDENFAKKMNSINNSFRGLTKKERKYLKYGLTNKKGLDESMVFDMKDLYKSYVEMAEEAIEKESIDG